MSRMSFSSRKTSRNDGFLKAKNFISSHECKAFSLSFFAPCDPLLSCYFLQFFTAVCKSPSLLFPLLLQMFATLVRKKTLFAVVAVLLAGLFPFQLCRNSEIRLNWEPSFWKLSPFFLLLLLGKVSQMTWLLCELQTKKSEWVPPLFRPLSSDPEMPVIKLLYAAFHNSLQFSSSCQPHPPVAHTARRPQRPPANPALFDPTLDSTFFKYLAAPQNTFFRQPSLHRAEAPERTLMASLARGCPGGCLLHGHDGQHGDVASVGSKREENLSCCESWSCFPLTYFRLFQGSFSPVARLARTGTLPLFLHALLLLLLLPQPRARSILTRLSNQ